MADSSRASTAANTITSSTADDTIIMQHKSDVLSAGEKTGDNDTLKIVDNLALGGVEVDLTSLTKSRPTTVQLIPRPRQGLSL